MKPSVSSPPKKSHQLVELLLEQMRSGGWTPGTRLPSERSLSLQYGVSRTAVREALAALQLAGYIETRVGDGSFAALPSATSSEGEDPSLAAGLSIAERLEAREALEAACGFLAMKKATRGDLRRLRALTERLKRLAGAGKLEEYLDATLDLHLEVAVIARSPFLVRLVTALLERQRRDLWLLNRRHTPETIAHSLALHVALSGAIEHRDPMALLAAVGEHYEHYPVLQAGVRREPARLHRERAD